MRQQVTYQTVTLTKGRHASPEQGACVMELTSMLAGEPFTDHPESVSASIASFLRIYNDILDDERRQDLYAYAAKAVGTAAAEPVEQARIARLLDWGDQRFEISGLRILNRLRRMRIRNRLRRRSIDRWALMDVEIAPRHAINASGKISDQTHAAVMGLIDELIAIGRSPDPFSIANRTSPGTRDAATVGGAR